MVYGAVVEVAFANYPFAWKLTEHKTSYEKTHQMYPAGDAAD